MALVKVLDKATRDMGIGETQAGDPGSRGAGDISDMLNTSIASTGLAPGRIKLVRPSI